VVSLHVLALLLFGVMGLELVLGPARLRLASLQMPNRNLQLVAALTAAAFAAALLARKRPLTPTGRAVVAGLLAAGAMLANTRLLGSGDSRPAAYLPFAIVRTSSLTFETLIAQSRCLREPDGTLPYWFVPWEGRTVSKYPLMMGLLALPIELPSALGTFDVCAKDFNDLEKIAAAILAALGVGFLFLTFEHLVDLRAAVLAAFLYVMATPVLPILGQCLWQHTGACLGFSLSLLGLLTMRESPRRSALIAFGAGLGVACRPPDVFLALGLMLALLAQGRRHLTACLVGLVPLAVLGLCNWATLGAPWATGYGTEASVGWSAFWPEGLAGLLVSPTRGLLLLYPVLIFAVVALVRAQPQPLRTLQYRLLMAGVVAHLALMAKWWAWSGAVAAAPRMLSDALPILGVGLALAARMAIGSRAKRTWFVSAGVLSMVSACLVTYVPPAELTKQWIWRSSGGAWNWRAYPPVAYVLGRARSGAPPASVGRTSEGQPALPGAPTGA
jgi:hypothetical protein